MYGKVATGATVGAGGISMLPDTGGLLPLGPIMYAAVLFVAAFTLIAAGLAVLRMIPSKER